MDSPVTRSLFRNSCAEWRISYYAPGLRMRTHRHDCAQFSLIMSGAQREESGTRLVSAGSFAMALKPYGFAHEVQFSDAGTLILSANIYAYEVGERWRAGSAEPVAGEWRSLARALMSDAPDADAIDTLTHDLLAGILFAGSGASKASPPRWLACARDQAIETSTPAGVVAQQAGVSRTHLAREFRRWFGTTFTATRRRARVARGVKTMLADGEKIAAAALQSGFADQAHLTREMRSCLGMTPGMLVKLLGR